MTEAALQFETVDRIGRVAAVDTSQVWIRSDDPSIVTRIGVGHLIAIQGATPREFLIGLTQRITRNTREDFVDTDGVLDVELDEILLDTVPDDMIRVVLVGTFRTVDGDRKNIFKRGADSLPCIEAECFYVQSGNLQRLMGLLGAELHENERLVLGHYLIDRESTAIASGDKFFQRHAAILGSTGSGKSWTVALLLERAGSLTHPNIIVLDMHGEYAPLSKANGGFAGGYRIAGPGDLDSPKEGVVFLPHWLLNHEEMLSMLLDRSEENAPNQASRFTKHVADLKEDTLRAAEKSEVLKTFTVDSPIPYRPSDLVQRLQEDNTRKGVGVGGREIKGEWEGKLTRFITRLESKLKDRRYGFLYKSPAASLEYEWLEAQVLQFLGSTGDSTPGIKIVDFSEVPSDVLPVVVAVFARLLYDVQFWMSPDKRTPVSLICDEAHLYLPRREGADAVAQQSLQVFERIAKEGRKYGFSIVPVSQRPSDVSHTILSQCNNFLALRLTNDQDQSVIRRLMPDSLVGMTDVLPLLDTGEALVLGDAVLLPSRIRLAEPKIKPASATRNFWTDWGQVAPEAQAIRDAVEALRSQSRPRA